jgi:hypothetical protein
MRLRSLLTIAAILTIAAMAFLGSNLPALAETTSIEVWKSPTCQCCEKWVDHLKENGFAVKANDTDTSALEAIKRSAGISEKLDACHTGKIGGYVIEGHVPASDVKRLIAEHPDAIGLTVPGMPAGSPGMEQADGTTQNYDVLLVKKDGTTEIFARH